ncbi:MAG: hypothetical protein ACK5PF_00055 [bacterium]
MIRDFIESALGVAILFAGLWMVLVVTPGARVMMAGLRFRTSRGT